MKQKTTLGLCVLGAAILLGLLGDALLRATPWGLNFFVWTAALVDVAGAIVLWQRVGARGEGRWLLGPLLFFTAAIFAFTACHGRFGRSTSGLSRFSMRSY